MYQTIDEYVSENATFWSLDSITFYYVYVDVEDNNKETLIAEYHPRTGNFEWNDDEDANDIRMNERCLCVKRNFYSYGGNDPKYMDVLMYSVPEEEISDDSEK